ncbi:hypothetical protein Tsubulata_017956, partial [Turnera subulata]
DKRLERLPIIVITILVTLTSMFTSSQANIFEGILGQIDTNRESNPQTYIVFVKKPEEAGASTESQDLEGWYKSFLPVGIPSSNHQPRIIHSYKNVVSGFAAKLTAQQVKEMEKKEGFLSAKPQRILPLHTTHSPSFLGLQQNLRFWRDSNYGKGVIIGVLDTGVSPDHPSFSDEGLPPPPAKWKGKCEFNGTVCNNKLIGARNFLSDADENPSKPDPPFDDEGHGTHTASTAAGNFVKGANVFGNANGTAVGMAPLAHLAIYKVCDDFGCGEGDILAAMDAAVEDGVDVLSLSIGGGSSPFFSDSTAVGAFGAIQKGVFVSCSAGNDGPVNGSLSNEAPWILTVGASTIDRSIRAAVKLGNGQVFFGESLFQPDVNVPTDIPLVYAGKNASDQASAFCTPGALNPKDFEGKIVLCERGGGIDRIDKGQAVKDAGGVGMILMNDELNAYSTLADPHVLPASHVAFSYGESIKAYINSTSSPTASFLFQGTIIGDKTTPAVSSFSSRGPSLASPGILKPDILGPGVSILAAWPVSVENKTNTKSTFNVISGTSMSCPHLSGIAALLKGAHPDWSPAAIKSAIMTSANQLNIGGEPILDERHAPANILATGAGHVNPPRANDPGLIYDIKPDDYIPYLCGLGYTDRQVTYIVQRKVNCKEAGSIPEAQLNYPSFSIVYGPNPGTQTYTREVTNVGAPNSSYTAIIDPPPGVEVTVSPKTITFTSLKQTAKYSVTFTLKSAGTDPYNRKMTPKMPTIVSLFLCILLNIHPGIALAGEGTAEVTKESNLQTYIVHVTPLESKVFAELEDLESWHRSFLPFNAASSEQRQRLLYSYRNVISGFSARLTEEEVKAMEQKNGFVSARPERMLRLHTTHSPQFLGLQQQMGVWKESNFGKGVIIGVLDGGVLPTHPSFNDKGMPPPPAKWKGRCDFNASQCNNKLIGARSFNLAAKARNGAAAEPPIDVDGHGTHTASTAAGSIVNNAETLGNARGTAVGMAPYSHLAIYKVCFGDPNDDCPESDLLAGLDAAVHDGVDILSLSLGDVSAPFFEDTVAVGSFAAIQKGIFVSCSAGNSGPLNSTLSNEAPWILTVGASSIDRRILATARLGNGEQFDGESLFQPNNFPSTLLPLVYAGGSKPDSAFCGEGALEGMDVKGKVVVCERGGGIARIDKGMEVKRVGGAAMILANEEPEGASTLADAHVLPATHVGFAAGLKIKAYINSTKAPTATILFKGTVIGDSSAPAVTSFSSRGPNLASPGILKPDIIGPGVSILAAWPFPLDNNTVSTSTFNIISGTSMSCPHLSGIAALLKSSHPYWSPAAIKSAIMTTADTLNLGGKPIIDETLQPADLFAVGAGHVNPSKANNPGLIYDIQPDDYIPYLCGLGYSDSQVSIIAHRPIKCTDKPSIPEGELNYPSFAVTLGPSQTFTRTVTNVGEAISVYAATIVPPPGVAVTVNPHSLYFTQVNQRATYTITFTPTGAKTGEFAQGYIQWVSTKYCVRSPIAVRFK